MKMKEKQYYKSISSSSDLIFDFFYLFFIYLETYLLVLLYI